VRRARRAEAPEVINFVGIDVIAPALLVYADAEQLATWLPLMASAEEIWCQLFSEPDAGSDLASLRTRAEKTDAGWTINGQKVWSTWAQFATWGLLLARTGTAEDRHRGITAFVIDMATPGIDVRPLTTMTGSAEFAEVFFDNVELPDTALLGELGGGWQVAQVMLTAERGPYAIRRSAVLRGAMTGLQRLATGTADPLARQRVAEATIAMELLDLRIADVVATLRRGEEIGADSALTKLFLGQLEQTIFSVAMEILAWVASPTTATTRRSSPGWSAISTRGPAASTAAPRRSSATSWVSASSACRAEAPALGAAQCMATPPLGLSSWPVMNEDASEAR